MAEKVMPSPQTIHVIAPDLASAWLRAMKVVFFEGASVQTEYDANDNEQSFDKTALVEIQTPILPGKERAVPHVADTYGVMSVKGDYVAEVVDGIKDAEITRYASGESKSYPYSYHDRLFGWRAFGPEDKKVAGGTFRFVGESSFVNWMVAADREKRELQYSDLDFPPVDQFDYMVRKIKEAPHTRRAQGITWRPNTDGERDDPPCLQRIWARVINGKLVFETQWRSRDLFRAFGANCVAMIALQKKMADAVGVPVGTYTDFSNSLHVYGQKKVVLEVIDMFDRVQKRFGLEPEYARVLEQRKKLYAS